MQYGLDAQWTENDARAWSTVFGGSGSAVADDGTTAQWPDNWRQGLEYYYDGVWNGHFIPNKAAVDGMAGGNTFQSGQIAMDVVHLWYTCCVYPAEGTPPVTDWDIAVVPAGPDGKTTSKLHADTIGILATHAASGPGVRGAPVPLRVPGAHAGVGCDAGSCQRPGRILREPG